MFAAWNREIGDVGAVEQGLVENSDPERQPYISYHYVAPEEHLLDKPVGRHDPDLAACDQQVQLQLAGEGGFASDKQTR